MRPRCWLSLAASTSVSSSANALSNVKTHTCAVAACLAYFRNERRNDFSAEAIAAALTGVPRVTVDRAVEILAELRASGDYDRITAGAASAA